MASANISLQRLSVEADKAAASAEAAKQLVRSAKAELKKARKISKTAKRAAKLARKKVEAAEAANAPAAAVKPAKLPAAKLAAAKRAIVPKARAAAPRPRAKGLPSAAQAAKAVITRLSSRKGPVTARLDPEVSAAVPPPGDAAANSAALHGAHP